MSACPHTPTYPDPMRVPSFEECKSRCSIVEDDPKVAKQRALTSADGQTTRIDSAYWQTLTDAQRAAVMAHERGHNGIGMAVNCEGCADKMGGYYMRAWGFSPNVVRSAYVALKVGRKIGEGNIADNAMTGARAAEQALAGRGLLGLSSIDLASARLTAAQAAAAATTTKAGASSPLKPTAPSAVSPATIPARAPGSGSVIDPGGPPTAAQVEPPSIDSVVPAETVKTPDTTSTDSLNAGFAGDAVATVLGPDARPHTGKVLIAAGIAATLALILVVVVRHASKGE